MKQRRRALNLLLLGAALPAGLLVPGSDAGAWFWSTPTWADIDAMIAGNYSEVAEMGVDDLRAMLADRGPGAPIIIDTRAPEEYEVSHLPGALNAQTAAQALALLAGKNPDRPVVVYCSVGVRSARLASELLEQGGPAVTNLEGSIFEWANRGWPLENASGATVKVHPFNERWGSLLERSRWSFTP